MKYLTLFLTFLKIGAVSFGGGYGMIPLIRDTVLTNGWMTEDTFIDFIAVAESTPGPIAVNMATFIGASQGGFWGSVLCTLGVILPAFVILLIVSALLKNFIHYKSVQATLNGIRPVVCGLIIATSFTMLLSVFFSFKTVEDVPTLSYQPFVIMAVICITAFVWKKLKKKAISPIILILLSGVLGILLYMPEWLP